MATIIVLPARLAEKARREAERRGATLEEIVVEALGSSADPKHAHATTLMLQ